MQKNLTRRSESRIFIPRKANELEAINILATNCDDHPSNRILENVCFKKNEKIEIQRKIDKLDSENSLCPVRRQLIIIRVSVSHA